MQFRLRYGAHDIELPPGEFVIGRGEECQLSLEDGLVSRRHAALRVSGTRLILVDLGSRNGVSVNGAKIRSEQMLVNGDVIAIGGHKLTVQVARSDAARRRMSTQTLQAVRLEDIDPEAAAQARMSSKPPSSANAAKLLTLATLAEKALALGRIEEAERLMSAPLAELMRDAKQGASLAQAVIERASLFAVRYALATSEPGRLSYVLELHGATSSLLSSAVLEELHTAVRKVPGLRIAEFDSYIQQVRAAAEGPAERFQLGRIEGLRAVLAG